MQPTGAVLILLVAACGGSAAAGPTAGSGSADGLEPSPLDLGEVVSGDTSGAHDAHRPGCAVGGGPDQPFDFTPPEDGWYRLSVAADYDSVLAVLDGDEELACNDDDEGDKRASAIVVELTGGHRYRVVVDGYRGAAGTFLLRAERSEPVLPEGRHGRLALETPASGTTTGGADGHTPSCGARSGSSDHVWHFVAPDSATYTIHVDAEYDSVLAVLGPDGEELICNDDAGSTRASEVTLTLEAGRAYGVVVDGYSGATGAYRLSARATGPAVPQVAAGGGVVSVGQPVAGDTVRSPDRHTPSCGARAGSGDDVWELAVPVPAPYLVRVDAEHDSVVAIYDEHGAEIACNDDAGSTRQSQVVVGLDTGRTYRVVVDGYQGAAGRYRLRVDDGPTTPAPPTPTPPPTPTAPPSPDGTLSVRRPVQGDTAGAVDRLTPSCGARAGSPDQIWALTVPRSGSYALQVAASYDSVLALYDDAFRELDCNDDHRDTRTSLLRARLVRGRTYHVVVDGYQGAAGPYRLVATRPRKPR